MNKLILTIIYNRDRFRNMALLRDGSGILRIYGLYLYFLNIIEKRPFLGYGLGGENSEIINKDKKYYSLNNSIYNELLNVPLLYSTTTYCGIIIG
jgi:hypothetical protein